MLLRQCGGERAEIRNQQQKDSNRDNCGSDQSRKCKNGTAKITMSLKADPKVKKVITVTAGQPVTIVKLTKSKLTLVKGKSAVVKASVGTSKASNKKVVWKSSNIKVAKVNSRGRITAAGGGSAVITAVAADGSGKKASCKVSVKAYVTSIKFKKGSGKMYVGKQNS